MATSTASSKLLASPLVLRLKDSQLRHGDPDITIHYCCLSFPAHLAVLHAKSTWFNDHVRKAPESFYKC
jgi:hypothetical protein